MNATEREGLKEQLRVMAAGRGDGIDLDSVDRWVVEGLRDPVAFFAISVTWSHRTAFCILKVAQ